MYKAIICKIKTQPIPGADKIQVVNCAGYTAIVGKDHKDDELGIFFPSDGQLSLEMVKYNKLHRDDGGYLENNRRIKTIKLMGIKSEGLWLPLSSLNWTKNQDKRKLPKNAQKLGIINLDKKPSELQEGEMLTYLNNHRLCNKYITKATKEKSKKSKSFFTWIKDKWNSWKSKKLNKMFPKHFDTDNIRHIINDRHNPIPVGIDCYVSVKLHGTSARSGLIKKETIWSKWFNFKPNYKDFLGTRNLILPHPRCTDKYRFIAHDIIKPKLREDEIVYYEIVGFGEDKPIMNSHKISDAKIAKKFSDPMFYSYGMKPCTEIAPKYEENFDIYVYRITDHGKDLSPQELVERVKQMGLKSVPFLQKIKWNGNSENILDLCKIISEENGSRSRIDFSHIEEGICLRFYGDYPDFKEDNWNVFDLTVKYKSWLFCDCEGIAKNSDSYIDPEEIEE